MKAYTGKKIKETKTSIFVLLFSDKTYPGFNKAEKKILSKIGAPKDLNKAELFDAMGGGTGLFQNMVVKVYSGMLRIDLVGKKSCDFIERTINFHTGIAYHDLFKVCETGASLGAKIFRPMLDFYDKYGIKKIKLFAIDYGAYVWARYGFDATAEERNKVYQKMRIIFTEITGAMGHLPSVAPGTMNEIASLRIAKNSVLGITNPLTAIRNAMMDKRFYDTDGNFLFGKAVLLGTGFAWHGSMDLDKKATGRRILEAYLKAKGV